ncbi:hypothetical protein L195_g028433, partial [Trifolium pratense]
MSSEASSSGGFDPSTQSSSTTSSVTASVVSSPTVSNVHDVIPTMPITTMAFPSVTAGYGRVKVSSVLNPMYGPPPTPGLQGMPVFEPDRYTSPRVTSTPLTTASVLSLRQQMDESNHEMVNLLTRQIGTVFNPLIQNTNESYQMLAFQMSRIADFFGTPPPPPRVNHFTPQVILPTMSTTSVQQRPTYVANETVLNPTPAPIIQEETHYPYEVNQNPPMVNQNPPMVNQNPPVVMVRRNQDADEVVREVQNNNLLGQNNLTNLVETILAQIGLNTGCRRPNFVSALDEYVLQTELPRGWKVPKYTKFVGDTSESTVEHIARCFTQVPEHELVEMAAGGLDYSIRKKLDT